MDRLPVGLVDRHEKRDRPPAVANYIYGHLIWGPIFNARRQKVFAQTEHWEPLGYTNC
jgi:hypothetical protein